MRTKTEVGTMAKIAVYAFVVGLYAFIIGVAVLPFLVH